MSIDPTDTGPSKPKLPEPEQTDSALPRTASTARRGHSPASPPDDHDIDFRPEDWSAELPVISADFVARTCAAVQADQEETAREAAHVDDKPFPSEILSAYAVPPTSAGFIGNTASRVAADRTARQQQWQQALGAFAVPAPTEGFVDRTLKALDLPTPELSGATASPVQPAGAEAPPLRLLGARTTWIAAAAAVILTVAGVLGGWFQSREFGDVPLAQSPSPWASSLARLELTANDGVALVQADGLLLTAYLAHRGD